MDEINAFLEAYNNAVIEVDLEKIVSNFHEIFTFSTPTVLLQIPNNEEFKSHLAMSFNRYKNLGAKECRMLSTEIIEFQSNHCMVNIEWGLINDKNIPFVKFNISYCMKKIGDHWKYIFVIDHNENSQVNSPQK